MKIDIDDLLSSIMDTLDRVSFVKSEDIPNIDLYMDQVTTFMDQNLKNTMRKETEDKILTKTMINNYAKNDLLPPPEKKKYSREHVLVLVFIYYFKGILSINDIQVLMNPLTEKYFGEDKELNIKAIYDEVTKMGLAEVETLKKSIHDKYLIANKTFDDVSEEEQDFLQTFAFICSMCFDIYVKKLMVEKMIDQFAERYPYVSKEEKEKAVKKGAADLKAAQKKMAKEQAEKEKVLKEKLRNEAHKRDRK